MRILGSEWRNVTPEEKEKFMPVSNRFNQGKPMLSYFRRSFPKMIEGVARVKELGAAKYGDDNWRLGGKPDQEYYDSMDRHLAAYLQGETHDSDSGCHHLAHAVWNLCALYELNHSDEPAVVEEFFKRLEYYNNSEEIAKKSKG